MPIFLAIDAGGTKTQCLLADETRVLARAATGSVKLMRVSKREATTRLHTMLAEVAALAGVSLSNITRTCIGLAGLSIPAVRAWATSAIAAKVAGDLILCGDEEIALDAAFNGGSGIVVIAGTGSNAIGRASDGNLHRAGGWGPVLGDEGAGYWIGLEAIRAALRAQDQTHGCLDSSEPTTSLLLEIQRHQNFNSLADLIETGNQRGDASHPAPDFAALAPVAARCAEQGDLLAKEILGRAGSELAQLVTLVFHKMSSATSTTPLVSPSSQWVRSASPGQLAAADRISVAFAGSVLTHIAPVREAMVAHLAITIPGAQLGTSAIDPLEGALWRARSG